MYNTLGINIKDIVLLKYKYIDEDNKLIEFTCEKIKKNSNGCIKRSNVNGLNTLLTI